ncbi:MAG: metal-binding protein [Cyclobacteriaceae bacterium]|jgi:methylphosphotriester-DNA--protein-cysteine methyltransferase|nr:metal-binding protein [Cyclobacteriaceae bacterium]
MLKHVDLETQKLRRYIKLQIVAFAGNSQLKIYGHLSCGSGKGMNKKNRVFFASRSQARKNGFRPCGHCMKKEYQQWIYSTQKP